MKRSLNYLILFANLIIGIGIIILLILFINEFKTTTVPLNQKYEKLSAAIAFPIVTTIIACIGAVVYLFLLDKEIKKAPYSVNPRLAAGLKLCGLISLFNFVVPNALAMAGVLIRDQEATIILLSVGLGASVLFELIITGFVSYFNLRISFADVAREQMLLEAQRENQKHETKEVEHSEKPSSDQATSGSF